MPKHNEYDKVVQSLKDEISRARQRASKSNAVPFGQEQLSARDARRRYSQMSRGEIERLTPEQRKDMLGLLGVDGVMARLRSEGNGPGSII